MAVGHSLCGSAAGGSFDSRSARGIETMEILIVDKAFDLPKPGTPETEPQDIVAPDITRPTE